MPYIYKYRKNLDLFMSFFEVIMRLEVHFFVFVQDIGKAFHGIREIFPIFARFLWG